MGIKQNENSMLRWRHVFSSRQVKGCPFDVMDWLVSELLNDHDDRRYLALTGGMSPCEGYWTAFLTPAELDCPMRQAFEVGEVTWSEYWESRPHIIRWTNSFMDESFVSTEFVKANDLNQWARRHIKDRENCVPFEFKREFLEYRISQDVLGKCDTSKSEENYREFMKVYERRMGKRAA